ncbi:dolichol-phosphate mannosyltransferase [Abditibacterium utsteinense]|uniref:Dolichol-phosphate mannosyltransferase n=1 Tax=Abditibacterium utsteinense TaxID=1960156 RepID=A0A2S8SQH1_9BACT|nr:polyprenol monophosphomannose synthase [Abditibacterium utsteinense]PQV63035.1 dolichol-phosphate mannosyltransferase [Abditibacterium utsteinense]
MSIWITIPTYNEAENIGDLLREIRHYMPGAQVLVVDDNSPDGTSELVQQMRESDAQIHLLTRFEDKGRGRSGRDGFIYALERGAKWAIEMDADFSHHPRYLPAILDAARKNDVVLGSRTMPGGREVGRAKSREFLTSIVGHFLRFMLGVSVRDPSSGFRCWSRHALETIDAPNIVSVGPAIVSEMLFKARLRNLRIAEVPIVFEDRTRGDSKLDFKTLLRTFGMVFELQKMHRENKF